MTEAKRSGRKAKKAPEPGALHLEIGESDLPTGVAAVARAAKAGHDALGPSRSVLDAVPGALAKRAKDVTPEDFVLTEVKLKVVVQGTLFGVGVNGEMELTMAPKPAGSGRSDIGLD